MSTHQWKAPPHRALRAVYWLAALCLAAGGCAAIPAVERETLYHNPFPQLERVAVLPFFNQSADPTLNQDEVATAYYAELQKIPGFEVMPPGVAKQLLAAHGVKFDGPIDFQRIARQLGVDVVIVGSVTDYSPYYPPRLGIAVNWYAAHPGYHPIPPGYGLPWGTDEEEFIPASLVQEAEFALAREQLKTQTPQLPSDLDVARARHIAAEPHPLPAPGAPVVAGVPTGGAAIPADVAPPPTDLPPDWPDPRGFMPRPPSPTRPSYLPQSEPIITHTRLYDGHDTDFTRDLAKYYFFQDDARFGGWQGYLQRSDDFIRFCCHRHIAETLAARGGAGETRVVWRWPFGRYMP